MKKKRMQWLEELTADIKATEQLYLLRQKLRSLLLESFEKAYSKVKVNTYTTGNKAGKVMALRIKGQITKSKIPYLYHPNTNENLLKLTHLVPTTMIYTIFERTKIPTNLLRRKSWTSLHKLISPPYHHNNYNYLIPLHHP